MQYGGNPVSCAVALAVLDTIEKEKLRENAVKVGNHLMARFNALMDKHSLIGNVRWVPMFTLPFSFSIETGWNI